MNPNRHPRVVWHHFSNPGFTLFGVPRRLVYDQGGFEREFDKSSKTWFVNSCRQPPSLHSHHHSMAWTSSASSLSLNRCSVTWLTTAVTWACNSAIDESGYSPPQWDLGRLLRLRCMLLDDRALSERIAMMCAAQDSITSLGCDRALSRAVLARSRAHGVHLVPEHFQVGDVVYHWRGNGKAKRDWAPMLDALRAPPVPPGRDFQVPGNVFMTSTHHRRSAHMLKHVRRQAARNRLISPIQMSLRRELKPPVLPRAPELVVPAPESPFQPVPCGNVAPVTLSFARSDEAMPSTPKFQSFLGGKTAPVTPHVEHSKYAESGPSFSVPVQHSMSSASNTPAVSSALPADPVDRHVHVPTQIDDIEGGSAVDTTVTAPLILPRRNSGHDDR